MKSEASETNYDWLDLGTEPFRKGSRLGKDPEEQLHFQLVTETLTDDVSNASTACKAKIPKKRNSSDVLAQRSDALKHSNPWTDHPQKTRARTSHGSKPYGREKTAVSSRVSDLKVVGINRVSRPRRRIMRPTKPLHSDLIRTGRCLE
ncbi:unnamed protein product [Microthlaspi erraticum]|uniref:Uncharacterized protein n=1 Tax=Microthlaspi erraticum TaxID=1685480 RepID=A0A6D2JFV9_9BRAS|nr:unnamed protein product [Microthlaspi erraticum]